MAGKDKCINQQWRIAVIGMTLVLAFIRPAQNNKHKTMRRMILMGCLGLLSLVSHAQRSNGRVPSGTPLKWSMNGSVEVMPGDLAYYYGSTDSAASFRRNPTPANTALGGNPNATRFATVQTHCNNNAMAFDWVTVQQFNADRYEIEQSTDGRNWTVVGVVPANRTELGEASYNFTYNKNVSNALFRIAATTTGGERIYSAVLESPCDVNSYVGVTQNPVYSATTVRIGSPNAVRVKLTLLDSRGAAVHSSDASLNAGINSLPLDMSRLPRGTYTLVIQWRNGKQEMLQLAKE